MSHDLEGEHLQIYYTSQIWECQAQNHKDMENNIITGWYVFNNKKKCSIRKCLLRCFLIHFFFNEMHQTNIYKQT